MEKTNPMIPQEEETNEPVGLEEPMPLEVSTQDAFSGATEADGAAPVAKMVEAEAEGEKRASADITHRLAMDFIRMQQQMPSLQSPDALPDAVFDMAARENIPLMDAFLRIRWQEEQKIRREEERRHMAALSSSGSLRKGQTAVSPEQDAFARSFRRALR